MWYSITYVNEITPSPQAPITIIGLYNICDILRLKGIYDKLMSCWLFGKKKSFLSSDIEYVKKLPRQLRVILLSSVKHTLLHTVVAGLLTYLLRACLGLLKYIFGYLCELIISIRIIFAGFKFIDVTKNILDLGILFCTLF